MLLSRTPHSIFLSSLGHPLGFYDCYGIGVMYPVVLEGNTGKMILFRPEPQEL